MLKNPRLIIAVAALAVLLAGCATEEPPAQVLGRMTTPFLHEMLVQNPVEATTLGYYVHKPTNEEGEPAGAEVRLDELLDDLSSEAIAKRIASIKSFRERLTEEVDRYKLKAHPWVDYAVVSNYIGRALFKLEKERAYETNPTLYVEMLGTALHTLMVHEYAPASERYKHLIGRVQKIPAFIDQAKTNLKVSPEVWTEVAIDENQGVINLVARVIPSGIPAELKGDYDAAAGPALEALRGFDDYLKNDLTKRNQYDWRLGKQLYDEKFKVMLNTDKTPGQLLQEAEAALKTTYDKTIEMAKPMHRAIYGGQRPPNNLAMMREVLEVVADDNRLRSGDQFVDQIRKDLDELSSFVVDAGVVNVPKRDNLQIIETPEFMRGVYSVAGFVGAPPMRPELSAFYWVTPIPSDWPRQRTVSKLREYNLFKLKLLTAHEAIPGHYLQTEFSNEGTTDPEAPDPVPESSRLLRAAFADPSYAEGWASYIGQVVADAGYQEGSDEFQINWLKEQLRVQANMILDIRMHTMDMSDDDARVLLREQAFQETEEARGKILRAKLTSAQLPLYYHGWQEWIRVRDHYQNETTDFSPTSFHDKALRNGAAPLPEIGYITTKISMD
jgi:uncharacterized protein (DUF885 family)